VLISIFVSTQTYAFSPTDPHALRAPTASQSGAEQDVQRTLARRQPYGDNPVIRPGHYTADTRINRVLYYAQIMFDRGMEITPDSLARMMRQLGRSPRRGDFEGLFVFQEGRYVLDPRYAWMLEEEQILRYLVRKAHAVTDVLTLHDFVTALDRLYVSLRRHVAPIAVAFSTGERVDVAAMANYNHLMRRVAENSAIRTTLQAWSGRRLPEGEWQLHRAVVAYDSFLKGAMVNTDPDSFRLQAHIQDISRRYRPRYQGRPISVHQAMREVRSLERRRSIWNVAVGPYVESVRPVVQRLVRTQVEAARARGYQNYAMAQDISVTQLQDLVWAVDRLTRPAWRQLLSEMREELGTHDLTYADVISFMDTHCRHPALEVEPGRMDSIIEGMLRDIGFDVGQWPIERHHTRRRPFQVMVEPGRLARIYTPNSTRFDAVVATMHEYGHAFASLSARQPYAILNEQHDVFTEAAGIFFELLCFDRTWLAAHVAMPGSTSQELYNTRFFELIFNLRCMLAELSAQIEVYNDPDLDFAWCCDQYGEVCLGIKNYSQRPDFGMELAMGPFHPALYLSGYIVAAQLLSRARAHEGGVVHNAHLQEWLTDRWFSWGQAIEPDYLLRSLTNEGPDIGYLLFELNNLSFAAGRGNMEFGDHATLQETRRLAVAGLNMSS
jgi:hypothetical protein